MKYKLLVISIIWLATPSSFGQNTKGNLFIIGGGESPLSMMQIMIATAHVQLDVLTDGDVFMLD